MADEIGREDEGLVNEPGRDGLSSGPIGEPGSVGEGPSRTGSPLGTDPQEASPLPGDPREAQEPQEPRTTHVSPGRADESSTHRASGRGTDETHGVVDQLREAWDKLRGKDHG